MRHKAVIGCGFGDEGKGRVTSYLCSRYNPSLIVRFSGGHQAGHHVITDGGISHVFSNFGSGTFQNIPTYWMKYCTVDPIGILKELSVLKEKGANPVLYIDEQCPVTTPYDKIFNQNTDRKTGHGSCGVGFGQTLQREQDRHSLLFSDLFNPSIFEIKLDLIRKYYSEIKFNVNFFIKQCLELTSLENIKLASGLPLQGKYIFEGSQGLLLDQDIGFFPHVSRTSCGSKNISEFKPEIILVTRAYQTRHGSGPMTNENIPHNIKINPYEQNPSDNFQGKFRVSLLDLDLLKYAINKDIYIKSNKKALIITCLDLIKNEYRFTVNNKITVCLNEDEFIYKIKDILNIDVYASRLPKGNVEEK